MILSSYGNKASSKGMLVILGLPFSEDDTKLASVMETLDKSTALDITLLDLTDQNYDPYKFQAHINNYFAKQYEETTVVIAIHGAQPLPQPMPLSGHYSIVGPKAPQSYIKDMLGDSIYYFLHGISIGMFNGNVIKSSSILKAIGDGAKANGVSGSNLNVWQYTCQGAKLLEDAQTYLPEDTTYVAESKGFYYTEIFLNTMIQTLLLNEEFSFDNLYHSYLAMSHKMCFPFTGSTAEPFKIEVGNGVAETSVQKADKLAAEIRHESIEVSKLEKSISKGCELISKAAVKFVDSDYGGLDWSYKDNALKCVEHTTKQVEEIKIYRDDNNFSNCLLNHDHVSYVETLLPGEHTVTIENCLLYAIGWIGDNNFNGGLEKFSLVAEIYYAS